jgi:hypothetical protein
MSANQKDTIYVDVEDEITSLIDKVRSSDQKIVALVLPKRATVLQSLVNMKLLKRTAVDTKKRIVLITSEAAILPLAGATDMYVARTLQSKPEIPSAPKQATDAPLTVEEVDDSPLDPTKPIAAYTADDELSDTIEVDNDDVAEDVIEVDEGKKVFNRKLKVPNFERFRLLVILGVVGLILLIVGLIFANSVLPKARIVIKTDTTSVNSDLRLTAGPKITAVDAEKLLIPAINKDLKKTDIEKATATGQRDEGTKATGTVKLYNCSQADKLDDTTRTVPAGTGVSVGNLTFILNEDAIVPPSGFSGGLCKYDKASGSVAVTAQNAGDKYNIAAKTAHEYSVAGYSAMSADGSAMAGGTSKIVKVLSQADIDTAKQKLLDRTGSTATDELKRQLDNDGFFMITDTLSAGTPNVTSSPNVNEPATEAVVTLTTTYTVTAIRKDDVKTILEADAKKHIDTSKQVIQDNGVAKATLTLTEKRADGTLQISLVSTEIAGPQLDTEAIKREIMGKKKGEVQQIIKARPGIQEVNVSYSPFWVNKVPKKTNKITIVFEQNDITKK